MTPRQLESDQPKPIPELRHRPGRTIGSPSRAPRPSVRFPPSAPLPLYRHASACELDLVHTHSSRERGVGWGVGVNAVFVPYYAPSQHDGAPCKQTGSTTQQFSGPAARDRGGAISCCSCNGLVRLNLALPASRGSSMSADRPAWSLAGYMLFDRRADGHRGPLSPTSRTAGRTSSSDSPWSHPSAICGAAPNRRFDFARVVHGIGPR